MLDNSIFSELLSCDGFFTTLVKEPKQNEVHPQRKKLIPYRACAIYIYTHSSGGIIVLVHHNLDRRSGGVDSISS